MPRPLGSPNKDKPFRDALRMETRLLENGEVISHPKGSLRWNAQQLLMAGEHSSIREIADRLDGKVAQTIGGDAETDAIEFVNVTDEQRAKAVQLLLTKMNGHSDKHIDD